MVIIVESWGLIKNPLIRSKVRQFISNKITETGFKQEWGITKFNGSTTSAGLKQFLNVKGDYQYFINHNSKSACDTSIFDFKQINEYHTSGFHSYTGKMFAREVWWPNIGMQDVYFRDDYIKEHLNEPNSIQGDAPFPAIKDELMLDYLLSKTKGPQKEFTYFLTVNSHLPFRHKTKSLYPILTIAINSLDLSDEAKNQLMLIQEQLVYFIEQLAKSKYQRIIIMGDHMPPFMNITDRYFYSSKLVPYLYLSKD
jgi:phosphoglycerol transferase MdoB-like AlkP superfamily enzyme